MLQISHLKIKTRINGLSQLYKYRLKKIISILTLVKFYILIKRIKLLFFLQLIKLYKTYYGKNIIDSISFNNNKKKIIKKIYNKFVIKKYYIKMKTTYTFF